MLSSLVICMSKGHKLNQMKLDQCSGNIVSIRRKEKNSDALPGNKTLECAILNKENN